MLHRDRIVELKMIKEGCEKVIRKYVCNHHQSLVSSANRIFCQFRTLFAALVEITDSIKSNLGGVVYTGWSLRYPWCCPLIFHQHCRIPIVYSIVPVCVVVLGRNKLLRLPWIYTWWKWCSRYHLRWGANRSHWISSSHCSWKRRIHVGKIGLSSFVRVRLGHRHEGWLSMTSGAFTAV